MDVADVQAGRGVVDDENMWDGEQEEKRPGVAVLQLSPHIQVTLNNKEPHMEFQIM